MLALAFTEACWWLGLFLLNRWPISVSRATTGILLCVTTFARALIAVVRVDLSSNPIESVCWIILFVLGARVFFRDAHGRQESAWIPFWLSFDAAVLVGLIFGAQGALITGSQPASHLSIALLYSLPATAIALQTFSSRLKVLFDRLAFAHLPRLAKQRLIKASADLREAAEILPRTPSPSIDVLALPETEFNQLVRRALSSIGDLPRLASSPLIYLPIVDRRLNGASQQADTLERAVVFKQVLVESIQRLKPIGEVSGTSLEWRHYNALYFPYIVGLKPYSVRFIEDNGLTADQRRMLDWFRGTVPERTLYNWQAAAAKLVATHLKDQMKDDMQLSA